MAYEGKSSRSPSQPKSSSPETVVEAVGVPKWRTYVTGLCALVDDPASANGPLHVVMPSSAARKSVSVPGFTIPVHLPFAVVPTANLSPDNDRHIDWKATDDSGNDHAVFIFSRERLSFSPDEGQPAAALTFIQSNATPGERPDGEVDARDTNWIADMRKVWPAASTVKSSCMPTNQVFPNPAVVAAQLTFRGGTVMTAFPAAEDAVAEFQPTKTTPSVRQVITRQCVVEQDLPLDTEFDLVTVSIETGERTTPIKLRKVEGRHLEITIGNADFRDVMAIAVNDVTPIHFDRDPDFELYRDIFDLPVNDYVFPVPHILGGQGSHDNCPVVRGGTTGGGG